MIIKIEVDRCSECPHFKATPYPTPDSFERPEYWWCQNDDETAPNEDAEARRQYIKKEYRLKKLRYVAGYVEWNDKIPFPDWCPCKLEG